MANPISKSTAIISALHESSLDQSSTTNKLGIQQLGNNFEVIITRKRKKAKRKNKSYLVVTDVTSKEK